VAFALQADGWYLRQDIIWHKPNPMPESVKDRCTKAHEYIFLLSKSPKYYFDSEAMQEEAVGAPSGNTERKQRPSADVLKRGAQAGSIPYQGGETRNRRSVWTVATKPYKGAHFATFPPDLIRPCILAGCPAAGKQCDCDEVILTPTGEVENEDPTMQTGRSGFNRPRNSGEGVRQITRREQRHHADEMRDSPNRADMEAMCGPAFAHYIRKDKSGARPLPEHLREEFLHRRWITEPTACDCPEQPAGTVLDPFAGSGTTGMVCKQEGRRFIGCELNPEYVKLAEERIANA
jgi:hypothetical protein